MEEHLRLLEEISEFIADALDGNIRYEEGADLQDRLDTGKMFIEEMMHTGKGVMRMMK